MADLGGQPTPAEADPTLCTLVSTTCTTAWTDWVHGDLWLCRDGLLRQSREWGGTITNVTMKGLRTFDYTDRPTLSIPIGDRGRIAAAHGRNYWIPWAQIVSAKLQSGPLSHALHLRLSDGRKVSLRWLRRDNPIDFLKVALRTALGSRLTSR